MSLLEQIRGQLTSAMKNRRDVEKGVLRCVLGDVDTIAARGQVVDDALVERVVRKIVQGNEETLSLLKNDEVTKAKLTEETVVLKALLPQTISQDEIKRLVGADTSVLQDIKSAKSDGQATGFLMKWLKKNSAVVRGEDVAAVVGEIRKLE